MLKSLNDYAQVWSDSALDSRSRADGRDTESSEVQIILKASYLALKHLTYSELANYRSKMQPISTKAWNRLVLKLWEDMSQQLGRKHICFRQAHSEIPAQAPCTHASQLILTSMVMGIANSLSTLPIQRQRRKKWEKKKKEKGQGKKKRTEEKGEKMLTLETGSLGAARRDRKRKKDPEKADTGIFRAQHDTCGEDLGASACPFVVAGYDGHVPRQCFSNQLWRTAFARPIYCRVLILQNKTKIEALKIKDWLA